MRALSCLTSSLCVLSLGLACAPGDGESAGDEATTTAGEAEELDVRVPLPAADPRFLDIMTPEAVIAPGEEKMLCFHIAPAETDIIVRNVEMLQGKYGHHAIPLKAKKPKPAGTMEDCTDAESMADFDALVIPASDLPEGAAALIPAGTPMVVQSHYVNAGEKPIRVRDGVRIELLPEAERTSWVAMVVTNSFDLELAASGESSFEFDCVVQEDIDLLLVGGHMHEQGKRFEVLVGPSVDALERVYLADPWRVEYRDAPPVTILKSAPIHLAAGDILRTRCVWENTTGEALSFPAEMCSTFGYAGGIKEPWVCAPQ